jgi:hypothetical protein
MPSNIAASSTLTVTGKPKGSSSAIAGPTGRQDSGTVVPETQMRPISGPLWLEGVGPKFAQESLHWHLSHLLLLSGPFGLDQTVPWISPASSPQSNTMVIGQPGSPWGIHRGRPGFGVKFPTDFPTHLPTGG